ncbi:MAG: membrane protein insertion efficiency factor YidD [Candidatus Levybacteria bacterium]|nr:membrane protein insertion efficiency factor YidD [Candidatus Levybacteria bacterium]
MKKFLVAIIKGYQANISPFLKKRGIQCLYRPTCSQYAVECLERYSLPKAFALAGLRLLGCNPIHALIRGERRPIYG